MGSIDYIQGWLDKLSQISELSKTLVTITSASGLVIFLVLVLKLIYHLIQGFRLYVFSQFCQRQDLVAKYGKWAVVTGATDGIGQALAVEFASRGMSLVIVGRSDEKLANTKRILSQVPNAGSIETLKVDLSEWSESKLEEVRAKLDPDNREIGILANNAGVLPARFHMFHSQGIDSMASMLNVNSLSPTLLIRMILPGMLKRNKGLIVTVSSMSGDLVWPNLSIYAPSKAFLNSLMRQVKFECRSSNVEIVLLTTGPVITKLSDPLGKVKPSPFSPSAETYARSTVNALSTGIKEYTGHWSHGILHSILDASFKIGLRGLITDMVVDHNRKYWNEQS